MRSFLSATCLASLLTAATFVGASAANHPKHPAPKHSKKPATAVGKLIKLPNGWPKYLQIPRFGVNAPVEALALNNPNDVHAPYKWGDVAWYDRSVKPGSFGKSVIFGHLDSYCCPAVFYHLRDLKPGDLVKVKYKTGNALTFRVMWSQYYWDNQLPNKWLYQGTLQHGLVLMTCAGVFHRDGTGYDHKLLVWLRLQLPNGVLG